MLSNLKHIFCLRPYHAEYAGSGPATHILLKKKARRICYIGPIKLGGVIYAVTGSQPLSLILKYVVQAF